MSDRAGSTSSSRTRSSRRFHRNDQNVVDVETLRPLSSHSTTTYPSGSRPLVKLLPLELESLSDLSDEEDQALSSELSEPPSSELPELPSSELSEPPSSILSELNEEEVSRLHLPGGEEDFDGEEADPSEREDSDTSTETISNLPPTPKLSSLTPDPRVQPQFSDLRRSVRNREREQAEEAYQTALGKRRERTYEVDQSNNVLDDTEEYRAQKRRWNRKSEETQAGIFKDVRKYIARKHKVSLEVFLEGMMFSPGAARWRNTFKKCFIAESITASDRRTSLLWPDEVVREQLLATKYRPVFGQLRKELFSYGDHLRKNLEEEIQQVNRDDQEVETTTTTTATASSSSSALQHWRSRLLTPLGIHALADVARVETVQEIAPSWYYILSSASPGVQRADNGPTENSSLAGTKNPQWVGSIVASLCAKLQPKKGSILRRITGMFVWSQGLSRLGMDYLYNLGVCPSYDTINRSLHKAERNHAEVLTSMGKSLNRVICYDNIQFTQGVRDISVGDEAKFHSFTTGFAKVSPHIPATGIKRTQFDPKKMLRTRDVRAFGVAENTARETQEDSVWGYYILAAFRQVFPQVGDQSAQHSVHRNNTLLLDPPGVETCLPPQVSNIVTLGELFFDESTESGNVEIQRDIHLRQFGLDESAAQWKDNIFLVFGDALTAQRIQIMQSSLLMCDSEFDKAEWILPVLGLWHLRYNYVDIIIQHHFGGPGDDTSSLYHTWHSVFTSRSIDRKSFDRMHKLITNAFNARVAGLILEYFKKYETDITAILSRVADSTERETTLPLPGLATMDYDQVSSWVHLLPGEEIAKAIQWVRDQIYEVTNRNYMIGRPEADVELENTLYFLDNVMPYLALSDAIKTGNISLLRYALKETLVVFSGVPRRTTYQYELCRMVWLTCTSATDNELADIILKESVVNTQGGKDTWYEMDRFNELINFRLRIVNNSRKTTSHQIERLITRHLRTDDTLTAVKDLVKKYFHVRQNNKHKVKEQRDLLWLLVHELRRGSVHNTSGLAKTPGRGSISRGHSLRLLGNLGLPAVVKRFNQIKSQWQAGRGTDLIEQLQSHGQPDIISGILHDTQGNDVLAHDDPPTLQDIIQERELLQLHDPDADGFVNVTSADFNRTRSTVRRTGLVESWDGFDTEDVIDFGDGISHAVGDSVPADSVDQVLQELGDLNVTNLDGIDDDSDTGVLETQQVLLDYQQNLDIDQGRRIDSDDELDAQPGLEIEQLDHTFDENYDPWLSE